CFVSALPSTSSPLYPYPPLFRSRSPASRPRVRVDRQRSPGDAETRRPRSGRAHHRSARSRPPDGARPMKLITLTVLAAVNLGGSFGEAGASTVSIEPETFILAIYVDVAVSAQSVGAHLSAGQEDSRIVSLIHRGGTRYGIRTELPRKNYMVVFEIVGENGHLSEPLTLTALGAQLDVSDTTTIPDDPGEEPRESTRWGWLALAL